MSRLLIARGLPASGKSTFATEWVREDLANRVRINRDTLRTMMHAGEFIKGVTEAEILKARNALIETFLKAGKDVVVDDTNLPHRTVKELVRLAVKRGAAWEIVDFTGVDVEECVQRDRHRADWSDPGYSDGYVGEEVIRDMHNRFLKNPVKLNLGEFLVPGHTFEKVEPAPHLLPAYIFDLDGTLCLMNGKRSPYDYTKVYDDDVNVDVASIFWVLSDIAKMIFMSGRDEECREDTERWIRNKLGVSPRPLYMRAHGDTRADTIVKSELLDKHVVGQYDIKGVFDDRRQVVDMWRERGLTVFHVAEGEF